MHHYVLKAVPGSLLFRSWDEGVRLFRQIADKVAFHAIGVMPEHAHVSTARSDQAHAVEVAMRAYALERNALRHETGPVFAPAGPPEVIKNARHLDALRKYIHLNPVDDDLVDDVFAWPLTTARDLCGFASPSACRTIRSPAAFHARACRSAVRTLPPSPFPKAPAERGARAATLAEVRAAVSALTRTTAAGLRRPGAPRDLLIAAARRLTRAPVARIAEFLGVHPATVYRDPGVPESLVDLVETIVGDPRFGLLHDGDLRTTPAWSFYRNLR